MTAVAENNLTRPVFIYKQIYSPDLTTSNPPHSAMIFNSPECSTSPMHPSLKTPISLIFLVALFPALVSTKNNANFLTYSCSEKGNYARGGKYEASLKLLLANLTLSAQHLRFSNFSADETANNTARGLFLCRGDTTAKVCHDCVTAASRAIQIQCSFDVEAIVWYEECILRYANRSIFGVGEVGPVYYFHLGPFGYDKFDDLLSSTFKGLMSKAVSGNSSLAFATEVVNVTTLLTLDCYVECTPDIVRSGCERCLETALGRFQTFNDGGRYAILLQPSCRLRYNFNGVVPAPPGQSHGKRKGMSSLNIAWNFLLISAVATMICVSAVGFFLYIKGRRGLAAKFLYEGMDEMESIENIQFDLAAIRRATENFSESNRIGRGGFGAVYRGTLPNGQVIAVKRLSSASTQGSKEFKTEACLLAKLQHRNLIKLHGFCVEGQEKLLVYELSPNKSLDRYLADPNKAAGLSWETRYKIIMGIARGLHYLHEDSRLKVIHRDLKPSNILLDADLNPKISDFGLAKLFQLHQTQGNTSNIAGTYGYIAPEYFGAGHFSAKSDVYSFGVILLELVSGRLRASSSLPEDEDLLSKAWRLWCIGKSSEFLDSAVSDSVSTADATRCVHIGLLCVQECPSNRPDMALVFTMLTSPSITIPNPTAPLIWNFGGSSTPPSTKEKTCTSAFSIDIQ